MRGIKFNNDYVKGEFLKQDIELLEEYKNSMTPILCKCSLGHIFRIRFNHYLYQNSGCPKCNYKKRPQSLAKYTCDDVKQIFIHYGCQLLSEYRVVEDKLRYRCSCGKINFTNIYSFLKSKGCNSCAKKGENNPNWIEDRNDANDRKRFQSRCRWLIRNTLKCLKKNKNNKTEDLLGYSAEDLRNYITNHSDWEKVRDGCWHLDHIYPIKAFLDYGIFDLKIINCLENLRPVCWKVNLQKQAKYDPILFENWLRFRKVDF